MELDIQKLLKDVNYISKTYNVDVTVRCSRYGSPTINIEHHLKEPYLESL